MRFSAFIFILIICMARTFACPADSTGIGKSKNGLKYGSWTYHDSSNHITKVEKYRRGKLVQTYIFNSDGKVAERINRKGHNTKLRACGC